MRLIVLIALLMPFGFPAPLLAANACASAPEPVFSLAYGSRYVESDKPGTVIDSTASAATDKELKPVDNFLRDLAKMTSGDKSSSAACALSQIAVWAKGNALEDLQSPTARLTVGSRIASFGLITLEAAKQAGDSSELVVIGAWLGRLVNRQMVFWEEDASDGAKRGNLRAWSALGAAAAAAITDDPVMRGWATWSVSYVLCTAGPDGSLPQEMRRGKYALHYQLHAVSALVVASALLERQGSPAHRACDGALDRVVRFTVDDLGTGQHTAQITGKTQNYFDGTDVLKPFSFAWIEAYLTLDHVSQYQRLDRFAAPHRPLSYSKLGGNQTRMWARD
ncbi:MAG: alginate lyase family protein [Rhodobacteraceae bacterium]|nr:alginate lyase family protein [Paracoccaceae bacterium]